MSLITYISSIISVSNELESEINAISKKLMLVKAKLF